MDPDEIDLTDSGNHALEFRARAARLRSRAAEELADDPLLVTLADEARSRADALDRQAAELERENAHLLDQPGTLAERTGADSTS